MTVQDHATILCTSNRLRLSIIPGTKRTDDLHDRMKRFICRFYSKVLEFQNATFRFVVLNEYAFP